MNVAKRDLLYTLLPPHYRQLDQTSGEALRALLRVIDDELASLEGDIGAMYDNWFIETCDQWVVPYLADLVGVSGLDDVQQFFSGQRRRVGNSIGYRRRKGTRSVVEQVVRDVTGWPTLLVEYAQQIAMTQHMRHPRPGHGVGVNLRRQLELLALETPFGTTAHTADLRPVKSAASFHRGGRHQLAHIGIFVWRLRTYTAEASPALLIDRDPVTRRYRPDRDAATGRYLRAGRYTFSPLGEETPLFNQPRALTAITQQTQIENLPIQLTRALFEADLKAYAAIPDHERPPNSRFYGPERGLSVAYWEGENQSVRLCHIPPAAVMSMTLWDDLNGPPSTRALIPEGKELAIDVERGRFAFLGAVRPAPDSTVVVSYTRAFSGNVGGGCYERNYRLEEPSAGNLQLWVAKGVHDDTFDDLNSAGRWEGQVNSLTAALVLWDAYCCVNKVNPACVIQILDNGVYTQETNEENEKNDDLTIRLPPGACLEIVALDGVRPTISPAGNMVITAQEEEAQATDRRLHLNGLLIKGKLQLDAAKFDEPLDLSLAHCTLMPAGLEIEGGDHEAGQVSLTINHSIVGPLRLAPGLRHVLVSDSIIDHQSGRAIGGLPEEYAGPSGASITSGGESVDNPYLDQADTPAALKIQPGPPVILKRVTVLGAVAVSSITLAQEVIFAGQVTIEDSKSSVVRFSYILTNAKDLQQDHCQPIDPREAETSLAPLFTSTQYGDPAYAQLSLACPTEIRTGAADGGEMGVFHHLGQPQRAANVAPILDEYLPYGLHASVFYVT